ncbi:MAG: hypothetical protein GY939_27955, partial [Actinomycetia bacterium]|nr:hypothetical protein [Actinomycetes bacterium]
LIGLSLVSFALVGGLNFIAARRLLDTGAREQLSSIGQARARSIEQGTERLRNQVSAVAADLAVAIALEELDESYQELADVDLEPELEAELDMLYQDRVIDPVEEAGLGSIDINDLRPGTSTGRYLQYHYIVSAAAVGLEGPDVADPDDGSRYSAVHAEHHQFLSELMTTLGGVDLLLISTEGEIVYSVEKRIDFATNLGAGPYRDTVLAEAVLQRLSQIAIGGSVIADWEIYLPRGGRPTLFVIAGVRRGTEIVGAVALQVPSEALSAITTANQEWGAVGLPNGESYVVGPDTVLRSESRLWIEDPGSFLGLVDDPDLALLIETLGSPVGLQPVDTAPVSAALDGQVFEGTSTNYLGQRTFSYAAPIDIEGVDWVMVADTPLGDARAGLYDYGGRLGLALLLLLPIVGLVGYFLSDRLARPIPPLVEAARAVAGGERNPRIAYVANDELGDLGRWLDQTAADLDRQERELEAEFEQKRRLLLSVLPARLVDSEGEVGRAAESVEPVTAVAVGVSITGEGAHGDEGSFVETLVSISRIAEGAAAERGLEPVRVGADQYLFLAGTGSKEDGVGEALSFAIDLASATRRLAEQESASISMHIGMSTGPVATGLLDSGSLTFGAWGEPVRRSLAIAALARSDEILVDATTARRAESMGFDWVPAEDAISLDGVPMSLASLNRETEQPDGGFGASPG